MNLKSDFDGLKPRLGRTPFLLAIPVALFTIVTAILVQEFTYTTLVLRLVSSLAIPICLLILIQGRGIASKCLAVATMWLTLLIHILESASYYIQGVGFDEAFFSFLLLPGSYRGLSAYPIAVAGSLSAIVLALVYYWKCFPRRTGDAYPQTSAKTRIAIGALVGVIGVLASPWPLLIGKASQYASLMFEPTRVTGEFVVPTTTKDNLMATAGKNLVLVYLESFDSIYLDNSLFPELTPNISRLTKASRHYSKFESYPGISYTMAGIFSSQCGVPFTLGNPSRVDEMSNNVNSSQYRPQLVCMGDVLKTAGYTQVFMGGADIKFAGKSKFFLQHGYDEVLGLADWQKTGASVGKMSHWGLYDDELFKQATDKFSRLSTSGKPFNLTVLSLDTHGPNGALSPSCKKYTRIDNSILDAVHCTDQLVSKFVASIQESPSADDTLIVIMGDHASMRNVAHGLYPSGYTRAPIFIALNAGKVAQDTTFFHMDVAPTILSLMKVESNAEFISGWPQLNPAKRMGKQLKKDLSERKQLAELLYKDQPDIELCGANKLLAWNDEGKVRIGALEIGLRNKGYASASLPSGAGAKILITRKTATYTVFNPADVRPKLNENEIAIEITPNKMGGLGKVDYSLTAYNGNGGSFLLADHVESLKSTELGSKTCSAIISRIKTESMQADLRTEIFASSTVSAIAADGKDFKIKASSPKEWFVSGWSTPTDGGIWAVGDKSILKLSSDAEACRNGRIKFHVSPYISAARPGLRVTAFSEKSPKNTSEVQFNFVDASPKDIILNDSGEITPDGKCVSSFVFKSVRKINSKAKETETDAWPITFSLESMAIEKEARELVR